METKVCINCKNLRKGPGCEALNIQPTHVQIFIDNSKCAAYLPRCRECGNAIEGEIITNFDVWYANPSNRANRLMIFCSVDCQKKANAEIELEYLNHIRMME
ncbi:MAG: hypothetical protein ACFFC7_34170 [Candidatus Hermodarchaeota archaeon]